MTKKLQSKLQYYTNEQIYKISTPHRIECTIVNRT